MDQMSPSNALSAQILKMANDLQSGVLPSTTQNVMHLMSLKDTLAKATAMGKSQQMTQQPQPTVKDKLLESAVNEAHQAQAPQQMPSQGIAQGTVSNGIDHLPSNLPTQNMAQGGIIAFDEGGEVPRFAQGGKSFIGPISPEQFDNLAPSLKQDYVNQFGTPPAKSQAANPIGVTPSNAAVQAALQGTPMRPQIQPPQATPQVQPPQATPAPSSSITDLAGADVAKQFLADKKIGNPAGAGAPPPASDALGDLALRLTKGSRGAGSGNGPVQWTDMPSNGAEFDKLQKPERTLQDYMNEGKTLMGENKGLAERENRLKKMEQETNTMEEKSPWLALMKAGIGAMKGTSQYALANIGAGAEEGLNDYIKAQDKITSKKDKIYDAQTNLADAKRNEDLMSFKYGKDSKQAEEAHNNTLAMHKIADNQATTKMNKEGAFQASKANAEIASADSRSNMSASVQLAIAKQDNEMRKYVADLTKTSDLSTKLASAYHQAASDANAEFTALLGTKGVDPMGMGAVKSIAEATTLHNQLLLKHQMANGLKPMLPPGASTGAQSGATLPALTDKTAASFFR